MREETGDGLACVDGGAGGARDGGSGRLSRPLSMLPDDCTMYVSAAEAHPTSATGDDDLVSSGLLRKH